MYNIEEFKDRVEEISQEINASGLKDVNQDLFHTLSKAIRDLNLKIIAYQEHSDIVRTEELHDAKASIEALFEFYMIEEGAKKIANYQVTYIKERLDKIIAKLNSHNYETIEKEFNEALKLYNSILASASSSNIIKETITKFKYQVFKYKLQDKVIDDTLNINSIIGFLMADIDTILDDIEVSEAIKNELQKYAFNINLIKTNFKTIIILLNLGLNKKNATKEEIATELESTYYCESEIQSEYHEPSIDISGFASTTPITYLEKIYKYRPSNIKEGVAAVIIKELERVGSYGFDIQDVFNQLADKEYPYLKYLAESLICKKFISTFIDFYQLYRNASISKSSSINYQNAFDCAIIAHKEEIPPSYISQYVSLSGNEYLINYMIRSKNKEYFTDSLQDYAIRIKNIKLLEYMIDNDLFPRKKILGLSPTLRARFIETELNKALTVQDKQEYLLNLFQEKNCDYNLREYILNQLLTFNDIDLIINALNSLIAENHADFFRLIASIEDEVVKQKLLKYYYEETKKTGSKESLFLIQTELSELKRTRSSFTCSLEDIKKLNIFEASYVSSFINETNLLKFVKKFYQANLDWKHILKQMESLNSDEQIQIQRYCYLADKRIFFNSNKYSYSKLIPYMLTYIPESIIDFLKFMQPKDIVKLDSKLLDIFADHYETELKKSGLTISDKLEQKTSSHFSRQEENEFLTYVMHRGVLTSEIMASFPNSLFYKVSDYAQTATWCNDILESAIANVKDSYKKAGFVLQALENYPYKKMDEQSKAQAVKNNFRATDFKFDIIFLTEQELSEIKNNNQDSDEIKNLKIRKYYGDLLRLIPLVPSNIQKRIIIQLAKSGIEEYIMYVKVNYPGYLELILENLTDISLYQKLIVFDGTYSIDDALRISLIQEDKPQALV